MSKLCSRLKHPDLHWQLWKASCAAMYGKYGIVSGLSQNTTAVLTQWTARQMCIFMQADVYVCAGRIPERPHHCDAQIDATPSSDFADHVG